ncbi:unnamed protein product [Agarophyton chilense]
MVGSDGSISSDSPHELALGSLPLFMASEPIYPFLASPSPQSVPNPDIPMSNNHQVNQPPMPGNSDRTKPPTSTASNPVGAASSYAGVKIFIGFRSVPLQQEHPTQSEASSMNLSAWNMSAPISEIQAITFWVLS